MVKPVKQKTSLIQSFMPSLSFAFAAIFILVIYKTVIVKAPTSKSDLVVGILENQDLIEDMELLETLENVELSDDEWNILLSEAKS